MKTSGTGTLRGLKETVLSFKPECYYIYRIYLKTNKLNTNGCFLNVRLMYAKIRVIFILAKCLIKNIFVFQGQES